MIKAGAWRCQRHAKGETPEPKQRNVYCPECRKEADRERRG